MAKMQVIITDICPARTCFNRLHRLQLPSSSTRPAETDWQDTGEQIRAVEIIRRSDGKAVVLLAEVIGGSVIFDIACGLHYTHRRFGFVTADCLGGELL